METKSVARRLFLLLSLTVVAVACFAGDARAEPATGFRSGESQTQLVELFSSEGCSSCPPADAWLASLRSRPELWKQFVPVEFHVDYWNRLGWTDKLSKAVFTERQQLYAKEWASSSVYTPGFVVDGSEWRPSANATPWKGKSPKQVGVLTAQKKGRLTYLVSFDSLQALSSVRVYGAILGNGLESKVNSGENAGSVLVHEFAVLGLVQRQMESDRRHYIAVIELPPPATGLAKSYSAAFWVTSGTSQAPLQAVGGEVSL